MHVVEPGEGAGPDAAGGAFSVAGWVVDPATSRVSRDGETLQLEPKIMEVLEYLARRPGRVVSRTELEATVWNGRVVSYDAVTNAIIKLRKAFDDDARHPRFIETLSKRGYRLMAPVGLPDGPAAAALSGGDHAARPVWKRRFGALVIALLAVTAGALVWIGPWRTPDHIAATDSGRRSLAVLPFDNLSGDPAQEYFADGVTDDVITALARHPELLVIARDSTFVYKGQPLDVREVAGRLDVRYVLHGSVRRAGGQVRINAQLVDALTGAHLWAERYEGPMSGIFETQEEIIRDLLAALRVGASKGERQDFGLPHTASHQAYDSFLQGRQRFYLYLNKVENQRARELFQKAVEHDPDFAMAYAMLAWTHAFDAMNGWSDSRERSLERANELAAKAVSLQEALPLAYFVAGLAYRERGEYVKALVEAEKAIEYDPNYANAHVLLATLLYYAGRPEEGLERIKNAMQLNPHHPYNYTFHLGQAYYILGRYHEAIEAFRKGLESNPASERLHVWLAAAYAQSGAIEEAEWEADQVLALNSDFSGKRMRQTFPFKDPTDREHFLEGLRKAGLSE
jgi:adenylate cyclase